MSTFTNFENINTEFKRITDCKSLQQDFVENHMMQIKNQEYVELGSLNTMITNDNVRNKSNNPVSAFDVACYVLLKLKDYCSTMKLHKILYYCQAWYLVWEEKPLFTQKIEAWANGPVIREIFNYHKGMYEISYDKFNIGNEDNLSKLQKEDIDSVLDFYGKHSAQWLINQTHIETPWRNARKGLLPMERGNNEILLCDMQEYYSSLK